MFNPHEMCTRLNKRAVLQDSCSQQFGPRRGTLYGLQRGDLVDLINDMLPFGSPPVRLVSTADGLRFEVHPGNQLPPMRYGWGRIETAPRDRLVLLGCRRLQPVGSWVYCVGKLTGQLVTGWRDQADRPIATAGFIPLYWRPLPGFPLYQGVEDAVGINQSIDSPEFQEEV